MKETKIADSDEGTVPELLNQAMVLLSKSGIEEARRTCEILAEEAFSCSMTGLYSGENHVTWDGIERFWYFIRERLKGKPYQYILGKASFMGLDFIVNRDVLIPRPETEILVETVLNTLSYPLPLRERSKVSGIFLDIGTGSGNIAVALAKFVPNCRVVAVDISGRALSVAGENAKRHGVKDKITFVCADLLDFLNLDGVKFDLIISNPPYIPESDIGGLPHEVKFEPRHALDGGKEGLCVLKRIISESHKFLTPGGYLALEIGLGQSGKIKSFLTDHAFIDIRIIKDYNGIDRVVIAK